ncbi:Hint domain-containing protein [Pseudoruegeria sp. SHC-113]|uniref:Hint domain-containing protein n=1 Tax=Pseudoruegeria sp. SHC-113 TaxID=2855439 RepID=UPI0021BAD11B|nr:Hint domain-containing protein [Pseudoruegeria sp. SHC-113]MCT8159318.1 Hint domain-containing protein [Pseudoruegeria sp. SHC-113]
MAGIEIWSSDYGLVHSFHPDDCILPDITAAHLSAAFPAAALGAAPALDPRETLFLVDRRRRVFLRQPAASDAEPPFVLAEGYREITLFQEPQRDGLSLLREALFGFLAALPTSGCLGLVSGTQVRCEQGEEAVESIRPGTRVVTPGGTYETVLAVARTPVPQTVLTCLPRFAPVVFPANALGNARAFSLAPGQGLRVGGPNVEYDFGEIDVLVAAREFAPLTKAYADAPSRGVTYHNLILSAPAPVQVGDLWTETVNLSTVSPEWLPRLQSVGLVTGLSDCPLQALSHGAPETRHLRRFEAQSLLYELTRDGGAISRAAFALP